jgi:hypothetical protein
MYGHEEIHQLNQDAEPYPRIRLDQPLREVCEAIVETSTTRHHGTRANETASHSGISAGPTFL